MATKINPDGALLRKLPIEVIREIGGQLFTPTELLDFKCICKETTSAIDVVEMAKKDAIWQINKTRFATRHTSPYMTEDKKFDKMGLGFSTYGRNHKRVHLHRPILLWAIETDKDIDVIRKCISVYQKYFPGGLHGEWFPHHFLERDDYIYAEFPSPIVAAAKAGRLDVIKALVKCGSYPRGRNNQRPHSDVHGGLRTLKKKIAYEIIVRADNAISAACEFGHEDIAMFLISTELEVQPSDIWDAVRFGCFRFLKMLLDQYTNHNRDSVLRYILEWATQGRARPIRTHKILVPLLDALKTSSFDGDDHIKSALGFALRDHPTDKAVLRATEFWDFYIRWESPPFSDHRIIYGAACTDAHLEILKEILEGDSWSIGESEELRSRVMDGVLTGVAGHGSIGVAEYLLSLGYTFNSEHLAAAIVSTNLKMVEKLIAWGVQIPARIRDFLPEDYPTLQVAYESGLVGFGREPAYLLMFRLIHHGADFNVDFGADTKEMWLYDMARDDDFREWYNSEEANAAKAATPSRMSFAERVTSKSSPGYMNQVHAVATLILGDDYMNQAGRRVAEENQRFQELDEIYDSIDD
ncbi:hypothetical protein F4776DRAFT_607803 [Hypoxylon sp. NC0597]|nr:hypothetical protein F4776DRAFT_607803 [Hypoxylon sp. NC0597]